MAVTNNPMNDFVTFSATDSYVSKVRMDQIQGLENLSEEDLKGDKKLVAYLFDAIRERESMRMELESYKRGVARVVPHDFRIVIRNVEEPCSPDMHVRFGLFAGVPGCAGGLCGELTMRRSEFEEFSKMLEFQKNGITVKPVVKELNVPTEGLDL